MDSWRTCWSSYVFPRIVCQVMVRFWYYLRIFFPRTSWRKIVDIFKDSLVMNIRFAHNFGFFKVLVVKYIPKIPCEKMASFWNFFKNIFSKKSQIIVCKNRDFLFFFIHHFPLKKTWISKNLDYLANCRSLKNII